MTGSDPGALALTARAGLPDALRTLVLAYPRATWEGHENFGQLVQFWMQRHAMFRDLTDRLHSNAQDYAEGLMGLDQYGPRLSRLGRTLVNELHSHHQIEDQHYFPQLIGLDPRVARGFDLLEADHAAMDGLLHAFTEGANAVLQGGQPDAFVAQIRGFGKLLDRHLTDEEEIIVPVILRFGFRG